MAQTGVGKVRMNIDVQSLERYVQKNCPEIQAPLDVKQFKFGQSNPTYFITDAKKQRFVMRKKPPGELVTKTAHAVEREYRIIKAVGEIGGLPAPKVYTLCEDSSVIGTPFYIMEFIEGRIFTDIRLSEIKTEEERRQIWFGLIKTMTQLHKINYAQIGLDDYGPPQEFYPRQLRSMSKLQKNQAAVKDVDTGVPVGEIPHAEVLIDFFKKDAPLGERTIVHGDYKMDNVIFHPTKPEVIGVLDWEMSTLGHPLSDLSNCLMPFHETVIPGIPTEQELVQYYAQEMRRDYPIKQYPYAVCFSHFRNSIIAQGIAARAARRQASSENAVMYGKNIAPAADKALRIMKQYKSNQSKL